MCFWEDLFIKNLHFDDVCNINTVQRKLNTIQRKLNVKNRDKNAPFILAIICCDISCFLLVNSFGFCLKKN